MTLDEELAATFQYRPETGEIVRRFSIRKDVPAGVDLSKPARQGYLRITHRCRFYAAHRLAWLLMTGKWPAQSIDHVNLDRTDNRWANLREASPAQNNANWGPRGAWPKGVTRLGEHRFQAQICVGGHHRYLGTHPTPEAAHAAYAKAASDAFGEFARFTA